MDSATASPTAALPPIFSVTFGSRAVDAYAFGPHAARPAAQLTTITTASKAAASATLV